MRQKLSLIAVLVPDYDEAIAFYTNVVGFRVVEDTPQEAGKRWVVVAPPGAGGQTGLLLARAANETQALRVGDQTGGRVFLFLHTDDFARDYEAYRAKGVAFREAPRHEPYGTVAVFRDVFGNLWDLIQPRHG